MEFPGLVTHMVHELAKGLPRCRKVFEEIAAEVAASVESLTGDKKISIRGTPRDITWQMVSNILAADPAYTSAMDRLRFTGPNATCRIAVACARTKVCPSCGGEGLSEPVSTGVQEVAFYHLDGFSCTGTVLSMKCKGCKATMWPSYYTKDKEPGTRIPYTLNGADPRYFMATASTAVEIALLQRFAREL